MQYNKTKKDRGLMTPSDNALQVKFNIKTLKLQLSKFQDLITPEVNHIARKHDISAEEIWEKIFKNLHFKNIWFHEKQNLGFPEIAPHGFPSKKINYIHMRELLQLCDQVYYNALSEKPKSVEIGQSKFLHSFKGGSGYYGEAWLNQTTNTLEIISAGTKKDAFLQSFKKGIKPFTLDLWNDVKVWKGEVPPQFEKGIKKFIDGIIEFTKDNHINLKEVNVEFSGHSLGGLISDLGLAYWKSKGYKGKSITFENPGSRSAIEKLAPKLGIDIEEIAKDCQVFQNDPNWMSTAQPQLGEVYASNNGKCSNNAEVNLKHHAIEGARSTEEFALVQWEHNNFNDLLNERRHNAQKALTKYLEQELLSYVKLAQGVAKEIDLAARDLVSIAREVDQGIESTIGNPYIEAKANACIISSIVSESCIAPAYNAMLDGLQGCTSTLKNGYQKISDFF